MTAVASLASTSGTLDLMNLTAYGIAFGGIDFTRELNLEYQEIPGIGDQRLVRHTGKALEIVIQLGIQGASRDIMIQNWRKIVTFLEDAARYWEEGKGTPTTFNYKPDSAVNTSSYQVLYGKLKEPPGGEFAGTWALTCPLTLYCKPWATDSTVFDYQSITTANYNKLNMGAVATDVKFPVRAYVSNQSGGTYDYIRVATRSRGNPANFNYPFKADGTGMSGVTTAWGTGTSHSGGAEFLTLTATPSNGEFESSFSGPTLSGNLATNGDFETGSILPWLNASQTPTCSNDATNGVSGSKAMIVGWGGNGTTIYGFYNLNTTPGEAYRVTAAMKCSVASPAKTGLKLGIIGCGVSSTPIDVTNQTNSKYMVESGTSYVTHTWDFIATGQTIVLKIWFDGPTTGAGYMDNLTVQTIRSHESTWSMTGTIGSFKAQDSEGEIAGTNVFAGSNAQGYGSGTPSNCISTTFSPPTTNATMFISARMQRLGGLSITQPTGTIFGNVYCVAFSNGTNPTVAVLSTTSAGFTLVTGTFFVPSDATVISVLLYCDANTGGVIDSIRMMPSDTAHNRLLQYKITTNLSDHMGAFRLFQRMTPASSYPVVLRSSYGGANGDAIFNPPVSIPASLGTSMVDLGRINIPEDGVYDTPPKQFTFCIWIVPEQTAPNISSNDSLVLFETELFPIDENYFEFKGTTGTGPAYQSNFFVVRSDTRVPESYVTATANVDEKDHAVPMGGTWPMLGAGTQYLYVYANFSQLSNGSGFQWTAGIKGVPRWHWQHE